ncbi:TPA: hypothetical protein HA338_02960 [Methanosarcina acetivorans]|uniref:Uncharacterized protein n=1 Tax=Methanosarcina acetivorans TaxID=2214 RepID=A0A832S755_9EURY|nr:hypothetical protein [Methanosarcina acetivorans]HIH93026.1 hypothetical protein [Methanosarcina acetivorans]
MELRKTVFFYYSSAKQVRMEDRKENSWTYGLIQNIILPGCFTDGSKENAGRTESTYLKIDLIT